MGYILIILVAVIWHALLKKYWFACIGSTLTSLIIIWAVASSHMGWFDKTFFINMASIIGISFLTSIIVGLIFLYFRKK